MALDSNFVQPSFQRFDGHYDHWSMLMENFLRSKEYWKFVGVVTPVASETKEISMSTPVADGLSKMQEYPKKYGRS